MAHVARPEPGYYKRKLIRGGVWVAVRIWLEDGDRDAETGELMSDQVLRCEVNGERRDAFAEWSYAAGNPVTEAEYRYLLAMAAHAVKHAPDHPAADPRTPIDLHRLKPLF